LDPRAHNNEEKRIPQYKKNKEEEAIPATASKQASTSYNQGRD
jgi:hypothetical protein